MPLTSFGILFYEYHHPAFIALRTVGFSWNSGNADAARIIHELSDWCFHGITTSLSINKFGEHQDRKDTSWNLHGVRFFWQG